MSVRKRAVSETQKAQRRQDILNSALNMFETIGSYDAISMKQIAENIGLTKGTLYLYFKTKEEVFLALYEEAFERICQQIKNELEAESSVIDGEALHRVLSQAMVNQSTYLRLNSLLHNVLEQNIELDTALAFKTLLRDRMVELAVLLEQKVEGLDAGRGAELMLMVHEIVIGAYHASSPSPCLDPVFERSDLAFMRLDFEVEFPKLLGYLLKGFLKT